MGKERIRKEYMDKDKRRQDSLNGKERELLERYHGLEYRKHNFNTTKIIEPYSFLDTRRHNLYKERNEQEHILEKQQDMYDRKKEDLLKKRLERKKEEIEEYRKLEKKKINDKKKYYELDEREKEKLRLEEKL